MLKPGDIAPDFIAQDQHGNAVSLVEYRGKRIVVLFFYPRDFTPICTREACSFRDAYEQFVTAGAEVIGVSRESFTSHARFAADHGLPFRILSDSQHELRRKFGVPLTLGLLPGRVTFVIDKTGVIRLAFSALFHADQHVDRALTCVRELNDA